MAATKSSNQNADGPEIPFDVVIAGAGYAGLAMALALKTSLPDMKVGIIDPRDPRAPSEDQRSSAIAASGRNLFQALGVWDDMVSAAEPIREMIVTDSETGDAVRPVFLTFAGDADSAAPFAHMVPNQVMVHTLAVAAENRGLEFLPPGRVTHFSLDGPVQRLTLSTGKIIMTRLLIAADGVRSALRQLAGIRTVGWQYGQSAIVCTISHTEPHHGRAWEHFLPAGPFAILPLPSKGDQHRSSLVWTEADGDAKRLVAGDEFTFRMELERRIGHELGTLSLASPRQSFPLGLMVARDFVRPRFALLGDAAHGIHPIAGQGLNLGLRDVAALAETLVDAARLGLDFGTLDVLQNYERWRRADTVQMAATTDILNRLFSNNLPPIRLARTFGLGLVNRMPGLKKRFIGEAAGFSAQPKLLQGELI
uniref:ubiquinone biosynthesis hydroxylase n=1 Tax=Pararhizobium sp. IMCC3301 TaxID=3067904 RepID=UPI002741C1F3|nr:ubiquinone biosynthesis hydroxylase [Pararhizobium sp. IMCC3301]